MGEPSEPRRLRADDVLDDAQKAVRRFLAADDQTEKRIFYVAALTLLRAVGHVLDKVDGEADPLLGQRQEVWWATARREPICAGFIEDERNILIKQYQPRARADRLLLSEDGGFLELGDGGVLLLGPWIMQDGPFAGQDVGDLLRTALAWWEAALAGLRSPSSGG